MAARIRASKPAQGPGLQVTQGGLPPAGFNKSPSGTQGPSFGASGTPNQGSAPPGLQTAVQRNAQSGDSKEGTPLSRPSESGIPAGGKGGFNNRAGGRAGK